MKNNVIYNANGFVTYCTTTPLYQTFSYRVGSRFTLLGNAIYHPPHKVVVI